jgi:hypothetical protein
VGNAIPQKLADSGIVLRESRPPSNLYRLNKTHVAAEGILALAGMWIRLLSRIRGRAGELVRAAGIRLAVRLGGASRCEG